MQSVMSHDFSRIPRSSTSVSVFDRSHGCKTAFDAGYLVPFFVDEVLPSDTFEVKAHMMAKMLSPMISAPMDNIFLETQWFYCPSRILYNNFTKLMGERKNPRDSIDYLIPTISSGTTGFKSESLADYFGIPINVGGLKVNALPFRMYAKVWDDWYRAEQLQDRIIQEYEDLGESNPNDINWNKLLKRGKRHDYFTSCLPVPQLGDPIELPLGGTAPVYGNAKPIRLYDGTNSYSIFAANGDFKLNKSTTSAGAIGQNVTGTNTGGGALGFTTSWSCLQADLSQATAITINALRTAITLQHMAEKDNRSGTRYVEILKAHFNCLCPDARLQRSEYLGGSSQLININQQFQQSATDPSTDTTPQGNRIGTAQCYDECIWKKSFVEHGYIIGLVNVRVDLNYQQGLNRMWSRRSRLDFYWPALANLGEQAVLNKEIYAQGNSEDDEPFGYQERYAEYRYHPSIITGKLRSQADESLDVWHLALNYGSLPKLNATWIEDSPQLNRVLAVQGEPQFIFDSYIKCKCTRAMPVYSVPGIERL